MDTSHRRPELKRLSYFGTAVFLGLFLFLATLAMGTAIAAPIPASTLPYAQNFNSLANTGTTNVWSQDSTINAWYSTRSLYIANAGTTTNGALYSFGSTVAPTNTERALGSIASGTTGTVLYGVRFTNDTGSTISSLTVNYTGEQWRNGGNTAAQKLDFAYQIGASVITVTTGTWTDVNSLDFTGPITGSIATALDGNAAPNRVVISDTFAVVIPAGQEIMLRWSDINDAGNDHGLSVDDLSVGVSGLEFAPTVNSTSPVSNATGVPVNSNITINFSEGVNVTGSWYGIGCSTSGIHTAAVGGGPASYTLDPTTDFNYSETCTVTITGTLVSDTDANDPPDTMSSNYVWSFTTATPPVSIHDIQGATHISPYISQTVTISPAIVTAIRSSGFYMQEPNPDGNDATSEGMFVFTSVAPSVLVGDNVSVSGFVTEFRAGGSGSTNLTITEITGPSVFVNSSGNPLPTPVIVGTGGRIPPTTVIDNDAGGNVETSGTFDHTTDGIDFYESMESMYLQINNARATGPRNNFGEISVVGDNGTNATLLTPRGGIIIQPGDFNPERIILDDIIAATPLVHTNDTFPGAMLGVLDYSFGNFKFLPTTAPIAVSGGLAREVGAAPGTDELAVASFNVENLDPGDSTFDDLAQLIVNNLLSPDIIAIEEIQDNNGPTNDATVDATTTFNTLITAIQTEGGPVYDFRQINPVDDQDGGEPGGNIRVGFLFRTDRGVAFVDRPGATSTTPNSVSGSGPTTQLDFSPGRIDPTNSAFNTSRKPLAGEFTYMGETIFVIANHFNSKGGDHPLFGRFQPPTLSSEVQRLQQATIVNDFVDAILAADPTANVLVMGDINDFWFSNPMANLTAGGVLTPLITTLPANERYGYVFDGNSQDLDQILASDSLLNRLDVYDSVHVNSEFYDQDSDHDPQLAIFDFSVPAVGGLTGFTANGYTTVTLTYTGTVPFSVDIYLSYTGTSQDVLLDTVLVTDPDGSQDFALGTDIDLVSSAGEIDLDYYLLAVEAGGSDALFEGVYHYPNDMVFVHGRDTMTDTIRLVSSGGNVNVTWNIVNSYTYPSASVTAARARSHGDKDDINATGLNLATYQMGGAGDDRLRGGNGNDVLVGGPNKDSLNGNSSTDKASYLDSPAGVTADIALGNATTDGWGSNDTLLGLQNLEGSEFDDNLSGNSAANFIHGHGGNDTINGRDGFDTLYGGLGVDTISGGNQDDSITGGDGDDIIDAGSGNDNVAGENGNDTIYGGAGTDTLLGHGGNDIIYGGANNDSIYGGSEIGVANNDTLYGEAGNDIIYGGSYNDTLYGGAGADTLYGGDGDDALHANAAICVSDGAVDSLNGGTHVIGDAGFYTFAQDTAAAIETATNCP